MSKVQLQREIAFRHKVYMCYCGAIYMCNVRILKLL